MEVKTAADSQPLRLMIKKTEQGPSFRIGGGGSQRGGREKKNAKAKQQGSLRRFLHTCPLCLALQVFVGRTSLGNFGGEAKGERWGRVGPRDNR